MSLVYYFFWNISSRQMMSTRHDGRQLQCIHHIHLWLH